MTETRSTDAPSSLLPTDPFDLAIARLVGLPNGAHTQPAVKQATDFYGNTTQYITQTVRHDKGDTVFVTAANAQGLARYILPPEVLAVIDRQREAVATMVRRRHGKRLAAERKAAGVVPTFTAAQRAKGLATRKRKAALRRKRKAAK